MTDNEIIKALECCTELPGKGTCRECPLRNRDGSCTTRLAKFALDLINRQKAEIESRDKRESYLFRKIHERYSEIEKWKSECENQAEVIKEFAERFKPLKVEALKQVDLDDMEAMDSLINRAINNLVKKMTEKKK